LATDYVSVLDDTSSETPTMGLDGASAKKATEHSTEPTVPHNAATSTTKASHPKVDLNASSRLHPDAAHKNTAHAGASTRIGIDKLEHEFHLFTWINELNPTNISIADPENPQSSSMISADTVAMNVKDDLREIDRFLKHQTGFVEALAYKECPQHTRREVYGLLASEEKEIPNLTESDVGRQTFEQQVDLVNSAETMFTFFLPPSFEGPTVEKFWGAIYEAVRVRIRIFLLSQTSPVIRSSHQPVIAQQVPSFPGSCNIQPHLFTCKANSLGSLFRLKDSTAWRGEKEIEE
jgi:hypothetical protein